MPSRRLFATLLAACLLSASLIAPAVGDANTSAPPIPGLYTVHFKWHGQGKFETARLRLRADHTGEASQAGQHYAVKWVLNSGQVAWVIKVGKVHATYVGRRTAAGFASKAKPAHMSNTKGQHGIWYAVSAS